MAIRGQLRVAVLIAVALPGIALLDGCDQGPDPSARRSGQIQGCLTAAAEWGLSPDRRGPVCECIIEASNANITPKEQEEMYETAKRGLGLRPALQDKIRKNFESCVLGGRPTISFDSCQSAYLAMGLSTERADKVCGCYEGKLKATMSESELEQLARAADGQSLPPRLFQKVNDLFNACLKN